MSMHKFRDGLGFTILALGPFASIWALGAWIEVGLDVSSSAPLHSGLLVWLVVLVASILVPLLAFAFAGWFIAGRP